MSEHQPYHSPNLTSALQPGEQMENSSVTPCIKDVNIFRIKSSSLVSNKLCLFLHSSVSQLLSLYHRQIESERSHKHTLGFLKAWRVWGKLAVQVAKSTVPGSQQQLESWLCDILTLTLWASFDLCVCFLLSKVVNKQSLFDSSCRYGAQNLDRHIVATV